MHKPTLDLHIPDPDERSFCAGWILRHGKWHKRADLLAAGFSDAEIDAMHQDPSGVRCHTVRVSDIAFQ